MKLIDIDGWYARVYVTAKIKKNLNEGAFEESAFPFDVGAVTLKSKDGKRDILLDAYNTSFCNDKENVGEIYNFYSKLEIDFDEFPEGEEYNYELTEEDLKEATGLFYCANDSDFFEDVEIQCYLDLHRHGASKEIYVKCENDS